MFRVKIYIFKVHEIEKSNTFVEHNVDPFDRKG